MKKKEESHFFEKLKDSDRFFYSKNFTFEERGGYFLDIKYTPKNFLVNFFVKINLLKINPDITISAINTLDSNDYRFAYISTTNTSCRGILVLEKSTYTIRVTVPRLNVTLFKTDMSLFRMHH